MPDKRRKKPRARPRAPAGLVWRFSMNPAPRAAAPRKPPTRKK